MEVVGAKVFVHSLSSRPAYNETFGALEKHNAQTRRWQVRMALDGSLKELNRKFYSLVPLEMSSQALVARDWGS